MTLLDNMKDYLKQTEYNGLNYDSQTLVYPKNVTAKDPQTGKKVKFKGVISIINKKNKKEKNLFFDEKGDMVFETSWF